jgi:hypothetical protein
MDCSVVRSAIGTAIACGAFVTGPMCVGLAVSNADLLGIGGGGGGVDILGIDLAGGNNTSDGAFGTQSRVKAVSSAPSARSVVIRSKVQPAQLNPTTKPAVWQEQISAGPAVASAATYLEEAPTAPPPAGAVAAPLSVMPPAAPALEIPAPQAVPITTANQPGPTGRMGPAKSLTPRARIPDGFRVGYAEYLRSATTSDILAAALPGAAGIAGFTVLGAYAGYRQAKAIQQALLPPVPTSVLL